MRRKIKESDKNISINISLNKVVSGLLDEYLEKENIKNKSGYINSLLEEFLKNHNFSDDSDNLL